MPTARTPEEAAAIRAEIRALLAQEPFYHARVREQGYTGYRYTIKHKGKNVEVTWREDRAREAVHGGTLKALLTDALPEYVTRAWITAIDRNARRDNDRVEARFNEVHSKMPATFESPDTGAGDLPAELVVPGADETYDRQEATAKARQYLADAARGAGIDARMFFVVTHRLGGLKPVAWQKLARGSGISWKTLQARAQVAMGAMRDELAGIKETDLTGLIVRAFGVLMPGDNPQLSDFLDNFQESTRRPSLVVKGEAKAITMPAAVAPLTADDLEYIRSVARLVVDEVGRAPAPSPEDKDDVAFARWYVRMLRVWARYYLAERYAPDEREQFHAAVKPLLDSGAIDRAVRRSEDGPYIDSLVIPALFLNIELTKLAGAGRIQWADIDPITKGLMPTMTQEWAKIEADPDYSAPTVNVFYDKGSTDPEGEPFAALEFLSWAAEHVRR